MYDFGTVNPLDGEEIRVDFKMLVADNPEYKPKEQYWMGVGVEYNNSRSIWVNDIAFTLAERPVRSYNFFLCLGEESNFKNPKPKAVKNKFLNYNYSAKPANTQLVQRTQFAEEIATSLSLCENWFFSWVKLHVQPNSCLLH